MRPLTAANNGIVITSVTTTAPATAALLDDGVMFSTESITVLATSPDRANTSPCAKLISWRMP